MSSRSLGACSLVGTQTSTTRGYCASDLIREAWGLEGHREGWPGEASWGWWEPELDLEEQAGICWMMTESLDVQERGSSMSTHVQGHWERKEAAERAAQRIWAFTLKVMWTWAYAGV